MNCRKVRSYLSASFDGSLASEVTKRLEEHIRDCRDCGREQFLFKEMLAAAHSMPKPHLADDFNLNLLNRIYAEQNHPTESYLPTEATPLWQKPLGWLSAAATVAACALVAVVFLSSGDQVPLQPDQPSQLIAESGFGNRGYAVERARQLPPMSAYENVIGVSGERSSYRATNFSNARTLRVSDDARVESLYVAYLGDLARQGAFDEFIRNAGYRVQFGSSGSTPGFGAKNAGVVRTSYTR